MRPLERLDARLHRLRLREGMSQTDLAAACGCDNNTVCNWEAGRHRPSGANIVRLAKALGVSVHYLRWGREQSDVPVGIVAQRMFLALYAEAIKRA
jgi:transcriptional regulator with XRE-family HTH domain